MTSQCVNEQESGVKADLAMKPRDSNMGWKHLKKQLLCETPDPATVYEC